MELLGKYLRLELSDAAMGHFFGKNPKQDGATGGPRWSLIGEVRGETPGVGLWFHLIGLGVDGPDPTWQPEARAVYLIRWDWVLNATILHEKPKNLEKIGFRPL